LVGAFSAIGPVWRIDPYPQPPNVSGRAISQLISIQPENQFFLRPAIRTVAPMMAAGSPPGPED
jgi:hypothetical protein